MLITRTLHLPPIHHRLLPPKPLPILLILSLPFHTTSHPSKKPIILPPKPTLPESSLTETFLKGSGPGGQKINKTSSAVQLKHLPTGIVIKSQATRSRSQNRKIARRLLAEKVDWLENGKESREWVKGERDRKRKERRVKRGRRKYGRNGEGVVVEGKGEGDEGEEEDEVIEEGGEDVWKEGMDGGLAGEGEKEAGTKQA